MLVTIAAVTGGTGTCRNVCGDGTLVESGNGRGRFALRAAGGRLTQFGEVGRTRLVSIGRLASSRCRQQSINACEFALVCEP
jgi:hypothetical protein